MMSFLNNELFPALLGAVFGLLLSIIFDEPLRDVKRNIKRRFRRLFKVKNDFNSHLFTIGDKETDFYIIDGDGEATFDYGSIETGNLKLDKNRMPPTPIFSINILAEPTSTFLSFTSEICNFVNTGNVNSKR